MPSPSDIRVLDNPETLRLIADPLRLRMLELLRQQPRTVTELAELIDVPRTKLYYHIGLLEEHDLVTVDATRVVSGITERRYRVTAFRLSVDKALLGSTSGVGSPLESYLSFMFEEVATEIQRAVEAGLIDLDRTHEDTFEPRRLLIGRSWYRFTEADVAEFAQRFAALKQEFADRHLFEPEKRTEARDEANGDLYELFVGFYPILPPGHEDDD